MTDTAIAEAAIRPKLTGVMWGLRITSVVAAAAILAQPLWVGLLYTGSVFGATVHGIGAGVLLLATLVHLVLSILRWKPGGGSAKGIWEALGFLAMIAVQALSGVFQLYPLHFPIGVLMAIGVIGFVKDTWRDGHPATTEAAA